MTDCDNQCVKMVGGNYIICKRFVVSLQYNSNFVFKCGSEVVEVIYR